MGTAVPFDQSCNKINSKNLQIVKLFLKQFFFSVVVYGLTFLFSLKALVLCASPFL